MERRLAAILAADVVGYSRLTEADEEATLGRLDTYRKVITGLVAGRRGRVFGGAGDSVIAEFGSAVEAVRCALDIQQQIEARNSNLPADRRLRFRIGVNLGDVVIDGNNLLGDGVNVAARLESLADPAGICVSESIVDQIRGKIEIRFEDAGEHQVKNISRPIHVWRWAFHPGETAYVTAESAKARRARDTPSVAILPFINMSGDPEQEYFSDGITEDLITDLSRISGLFVPARNSTFVYKGVTVKVERVAEELGVRYVIEGSVRKAGGRVRITAQLIDAATGGHMWAERYDRDLTDVFAVQDEITHKIVDALRVTLLPSERKAIEKVPTENVEAYQFYLRGRQFFHRHSKNNYEIAKRMFRRAIELDPNYARAYAGLADCESFLYMYYFQVAAMENILQASAKAMELDEDLAEAHASRGLALFTIERHAEAESEFQMAIRLDPNLYEAYYFYARACLTQGRPAEAAELLEKALQVRPDDFVSSAFLAQTYRDLGRRPDSETAAWRALEQAERELQLRPENVRAVYIGATVLAALGERARAKEWASRALAMEPDDLLTLFNVACVYALLGEEAAALHLLERAVPLGHGEIKLLLQNDSDLKSLHGHPRFQALLQRVAG
ncbi:MAG: tetratricopeptide repeat protein [Rhodospirillales bacterium]|nr:tetratricopeptide repeat protein [Rhodospirillales bacterium]